MTPEIEKRIKAVKAGRVPAAHCLDGKKSQWNHLQISDLFDEVCEKNHPDADVLTIIQGTGTVLREESGREIIYDENSLASYKFVKKDDFIIHLRSFEGGLEVANQDGIVSPAYIILRPKIDVSTVYLYALFHSNQFINQTMAPAVEGARDGRSVKYDVLKKQKIFLPPLSEQKKIAEILSAQDKIIELKEKLIAEKQRQKKYLMSVLLGDDFKKPFKLNGVTIDKKKWEKKRIEDVAIMSSGSTPRRDSKDNFCGNILWLSSGELKQKYICDTEEKISDKAAKESNLRVYPEGTFVIAMYGLEAAGIRGTASIIKAKSTISQACMAFTDLNNITNEFLYYWYLYNGQIIGSKYAQGSKQQNLNSDLMGKIQINLPSLPEQKAIADVLSAADEEISLLQKDLEQEKLKKKSLMQLLLTGLVRVA